MVEKLRPRYTFTEDRLEQLRIVVPEAFADGKINGDVLLEAIGEHLEDEDGERFGLFWPGKREARRLASMPSKGTLIPVPGEGVNEDKTSNIFIEGENLEVLKLLLKSYAGRVKMIYIDPPYNTGNDFIYTDDYSEPLIAYLHRTGQVDEGEELLTTNTRTSGRYHSNWLNMLYPRMLLTRQLLHEDGVIFVSIDDNELAHLKLLMNEVFGEENFFAQVIIRANSRGQTYKQIAKTHEYLLIYTNSPETELFELEKTGLKDDLNLTDLIGKFNIRELRNRNPKFGRHNRPNLFYPIYVNPDSEDNDGFFPISLERTSSRDIKIFPYNSQGKESCWRWGKDRVLRNIHEETQRSNVVAKKKADENFGVYEKYRKPTYKPKSIWRDNTFLNETGTIELRKLGLQECFDFPKPIGLIKQCLALSTDDNDIVMDFFAGSCTTAQALITQNQEDGGSRSFIMVQLPEPVPQDSPASNMGMHTIADIGKERIHRAMQNLAEEYQGKPGADARKPILGFKVFKLTRSNFGEWQDYQGEDLRAYQLRLAEMADSPLVDDWKAEDLLVELLLQQGFPLDSQVKTIPESGPNNVYKVQSDFHEFSLYVCLDEQIATATVEHLFNLSKEDVFICLDSALMDELKMRLDDTLNLYVI
jgi:adenine-specific DNA-methyltransferase